MYVREHFDEDARHSANDMVKDIRSVVNDILDGSKWMDNKTRTNAKNKMAAMTAHIGYPVELLDDQKLTIFCENVVYSYV